MTITNQSEYPPHSQEQTPRSSGYNPQQSIPTMECNSNHRNYPTYPPQSFQSSSEFNGPSTNTPSSNYANNYPEIHGQSLTLNQLLQQGSTSTSYPMRPQGAPPNQSPYRNYEGYNYGYKSGGPQSTIERPQPGPYSSYLPPNANNQQRYPSAAAAADAYVPRPPHASYQTGPAPSYSYYQQQTSSASHPRLPSTDYPPSHRQPDGRPPSSSPVHHHHQPSPSSGPASGQQPTQWPASSSAPTTGAHSFGSPRPIGRAGDFTIADGQQPQQNSDSVDEQQLMNRPHSRLSDTSAVSNTSRRVATSPNRPPSSSSYTKSRGGDNPADDSMTINDQPSIQHQDETAVGKSSRRTSPFPSSSSQQQQQPPFGTTGGYPSPMAPTRSHLTNSLSHHHGMSPSVKHHPQQPYPIHHQQSSLPPSSSHLGGPQGPPPPPHNQMMMQHHPGGSPYTTMQPTRLPPSPYYGRPPMMRPSMVPPSSAAPPPPASSMLVPQPHASPQGATPSGGPPGWPDSARSNSLGRPQQPAAYNGPPSADRGAQQPIYHHSAGGSHPVSYNSSYPPTAAYLQSGPYPPSHQGAPYHYHHHQGPYPSSHPTSMQFGNDAVRPGLAVEQSSAGPDQVRQLRSPVRQPIASPSLASITTDSGGGDGSASSSGDRIRISNQARSNTPGSLMMSPPGATGQSTSNTEDLHASGQPPFGSPTGYWPPGAGQEHPHFGGGPSAPFLPSNFHPHYRPPPPGSHYAPPPHHLSGHPLHHQTPPTAMSPQSANCLRKLCEMGSEPDRRHWLEHYARFMDDIGKPLVGLPQIVKQPLDLYRFYWAVRERGGVLDVIKARRWKEITQFVNINASASAAYTLRKNYCKFLLDYEARFDRGLTDSRPLQAQIDALSSKSSKKKTSSASSLDAMSGGGGDVSQSSGFSQQPIPLSPSGSHSSASSSLPHHPPPPPGQLLGGEAPRQPTPNTSGIGESPGGGGIDASPVLRPEVDQGTPCSSTNGGTGGGTYPLTQMTEQARWSWTTATSDPPSSSCGRFSPSAPSLRPQGEGGPHDPNLPPPRGLATAAGPPIRPPSSSSDVKQSSICTSSSSSVKPGTTAEPARLSTQQQSFMTITGHPPPHMVPQQQHSARPQSDPLALYHQARVQQLRANAPPPNNQAHLGSGTVPAHLIHHHGVRPSYVATILKRIDHHPFPVGSIEATQIETSRKRRYRIKDLGPISPFKLLMALRSGLTAELAWALNCLNVMLHDDLGLDHLPTACLQSLTTNLIIIWRRTLGELFDVDSFITGFELPPIGGLTLSEDDAAPDLLSDYDHSASNENLLPYDDDLVDVEQELIGLAKQHGICPKDFRLGIRNLLSGKKRDAVSHTVASRDRRQLINDLANNDPYPWRSRRHVVLSSNRLRSPEALRNLRQLALYVLEDLSPPRSTVNNETSVKVDLLQQLLLQGGSDTSCHIMPSFGTLPTTKRRQSDDESHPAKRLRHASASSLSCPALSPVQPIEEGELDSQPSIEDEDCPLRARQDIVHHGVTYLWPTDANDSMAVRCLCASTVLRNLSFYAQAESHLVVHKPLLALLGRLLLLGHDHVRPSDSWQSIDKRASQLPTPSSNCAWQTPLWLEEMRENVLVILVNLAGQLELIRLHENIVRPILEGLMHWVVCPTAPAIDPLPGQRLIGPRRLALEAVNRLCVHQSNVDLLLTTKSQPLLGGDLDETSSNNLVEQLINRLVSWLALPEDQITRELALSTLHYLAGGGLTSTHSDSTSSKRDPAGFLPSNHLGLLLTANAHPYPVAGLLAFIETAESTTRRVIDQFGVQALQERPELMGTSLEMVRRAASLIDRLASACNEIDDSHLRRRFTPALELRLIDLVTSRVLDATVAHTLCGALHRLSSSAKVTPVRHLEVVVPSVPKEPSSAEIDRLIASTANGHSPPPNQSKPDEQPSTVKLTTKESQLNGSALKSVAARLDSSVAGDSRLNCVVDSS